MKQQPKEKYFGKDYLHELWTRTTVRNGKRTYFVPIALGFIFVLLMFFTIFDLNFTNTTQTIGSDPKAALSLAGWHGNDIFYPSKHTLTGIGAAAKVLLLIGTPLSMFAAYNRIGQLKQDYFFSVICNIFIGLGLVLSIQSAPMVLSAVQNVFIYLMFSAVGLSLSLNQTQKVKTNVIRPENKFISQPLWVSIISTLLGISLFAVILVVISGSGSQVFNTPEHKAMTALLLMGIGFSIGGISTMYFAKWKYTFISWQMSNVVLGIYYIWVSVEAGNSPVGSFDSYTGGAQLWGIVIITMAYLVLDSIAMVRWMVASKEDKELDAKLS